jgi:hypothetical protein
LQGGHGREETGDFQVLGHGGPAERFLHQGRPLKYLLAKNAPKAL